MAWAAIASSGLLLISAGITANLAHQAIVAQRYRIRVLATRHVQGLALPLVPRKAWGRVRTNLDDAATRGAGPVGDVVRATDLVIGPGGAPSAAVAAARRTVVPGRGSEAVARTTTTTGERVLPRPRLTEGGAEITPRRTVARDGEAPAARRRPAPGAAGQVAPRRRPPVAGARGEGTGVAARARSGVPQTGTGTSRGAAAAAARRSATTGAAVARRSATTGAAATRRTPRARCGGRASRGDAWRRRRSRRSASGRSQCHWRHGRPTSTRRRSGGAPPGRLRSCRRSHCRIGRRRAAARGRHAHHAHHAQEDRSRPGREIGRRRRRTAPRHIT